MRYFAGRLVAGLATVLAVSVLVFGAMHMMPGSYADIVLGPYSSAEARDSLAAEFGLDRPAPLQYFEWLRHLLTGDLGSSLGTGEPVSEQLAQRLPVTLELALLAFVMTVLVGVPMGLLAGIATRSWARVSSRLVGSTAMSVPDFVLGSLFVFLFSRYTLGLPAGGYVPFGEDPLGSIKSMILPSVTLSVFGVALVVRTARDSVASVFSAPHVVAAIARGESMSHVVRHHILRNASIPLVTVLATYAGYLMGGAVIVETLFSLPGVGQAVQTAIKGRDYAVVQGMVMVAAAAFIAISLFADFTYGLLDPRVRAKQ